MAIRQMIVNRRSGFLYLVLLLFTSSSATAEWLANAGAGLSYKDNYNLQNGNYDNIALEQVSRTGTELSAAFSWQSLQAAGGYSIDLQGMLDKASNSNNKISNLNLSVSRLQPLSAQWMSRLSGSLIRYTNDDFTVNNFNGLSFAVTAGYFAKDRQGLDINLNWITEDHDQDPQSLYKIQRLGSGIVYYFPSQPGSIRNSFSFAMQKHDSNDDRRDAFSLLSSLDVDQLWWGKNLFRLTLSWRQDQYDQAYTPSPGSPMFPTLFSAPGFAAMDPGTGSGGGAGTGGPGSGNPGGGINTTDARKDNQLYLTASYRRQISQQLRLFISANGGKYISVSVPGRQTFYNLFAGVRWYTN